MTPIKLTRRTAFRVAAVFVSLFSLTMILIFAVLYFLISRDLTNGLKDQIEDTRETIISASATGRSGLAAMVRRHSAAQQDDSILLLTDLNGNYIAGNILSIPRFAGWKSIEMSKLPLVRVWTLPTESTAFLGRWTIVPNGYLFVAGGNADVNDVQEFLVSGLGWAVVLTAVSAIFGGAILGLSAQRRVDAMEQVLGSFAHGNLADRVRRSRSGDDLDHVAQLINDTLDRLQRLIGSVKQVTTDIAHDLKTPISRIRQKLEVAQVEDRNVEAYRATIDNVLGDIDQVVETFEALLRIAEIGSGARKARFVEVSLQTVLADVVEALEAVAEDQGQTLRADFIGERDESILGDRQLLNQLFVNLVENSIRHCPAGSTIKITTQSDPDNVIVRVCDNGPGIPAEERQYVFRPLYRLEKSRTTPGSGLGLSLVAAIAELHDGRVTLGDAHPGLVVSVYIHRVTHTS